MWRFLHLVCFALFWKTLEINFNIAVVVLHKSLWNGPRPTPSLLFSWSTASCVLLNFALSGGTVTTAVNHGRGSLEVDCLLPKLVAKTSAAVTMFKRMCHTSLADCFSLFQYCSSASSATTQPSHLRDNSEYIQWGGEKKKVSFLNCFKSASTFKHSGSDSPSSLTLRNPKWLQGNDSLSLLKMAYLISSN